MTRGQLLSDLFRMFCILADLFSLYRALVCLFLTDLPVRPVLYEDLQDVVQRGWALDAAVLTALERETVDEAQLQALNDQVCQCQCR